jgi:hypothetical protein
MTSPTPALEYVSGLVSHHGLAPERADLLADYITDRCAGLSLASAHSSSFSNLYNDTFLVHDMRLTRRQISAWLALIRGTRAVRLKDGRVTGGYPGLVEVLAVGELDPARRRRFERLAARAAGTSPSRPHLEAPGRSFAPTV